MIKKLISLLFVLAALAAGGFFYVAKQVDSYVGQPIQIEQQEVVAIRTGASLTSVISQLTSKGWFEDDELSSRLLRRFYPELTQVKAGTYVIEPSQTLYQVIEQIVEGKEHQFSITFVEGSRFDEWLEALSQAPQLENLTQDLTEAQIAEKLGIENEKLEGLFLAETYHYTAGTSDLEILSRAYKQLDTILTKAWEAKQADLPLDSPYEALILASIIEKETAVAQERERVAAVFVNRLNKGMRLQTDPTVIYGMGDKYQGHIGRKGLDTPTPYNTYIIRGLPPTPIAMPGRASVLAALNPEDSDYLYFVASGKGGHVFSKNLADHNRAVRAYLKHIRSN